MKPKRNSKLLLRRLLIYGLQKSGFDLNTAKDIADVQIDTISSEKGGESFYMSVKRKTETKLRNKKIRREYESSSIKELAVRYDLTTRTVYRIVAKY